MILNEQTEMIDPPTGKSVLGSSTEPLNELEQLNDIYKILSEIRYTGAKMREELEFNIKECDDFEEWEQNIEDKGDKIDHWIDEFEELLVELKT